MRGIYHTCLPIYTIKLYVALSMYVAALYTYFQFDMEYIIDNWNWYYVIGFGMFEV